ncbi:hypothetical protein [Microbacterium sp. CJ88]|uniref:hypothetical protein n=1 Tax=Microbacterium sp. CJ88 TaxID=3445672 RepID=UPI003F655EBD
MGFWDRLMGNDDTARQTARPQASQPVRSEDEIAIERYRYLLRTAPPETIEQVHAEAFARLTEPQRQQVLAELSAGLDPAEQPRSTDPQAMARAATRAEYRSPGFMERTLGPGGRSGQGSGPGFGAMVGSSILGTVAGYVIGSALVSTFMAPAFADGGDGGSGDAGSADAGGDGGSADAAGAGDAGGWGDSGFGGDFGGGDFGGGDFGGF